MICWIKWIFYKKAEGPVSFRRSKNTELTTIAGFVSSRQSHKTTTRQEVELFRYMYTSQWKSVDKSVFSTFPDKLRLFEIDVTMTYVRFAARSVNNRLTWLREIVGSTNTSLRVYTCTCIVYLFIVNMLCPLTNIVSKVLHKIYVTVI